MNEVELRKNVCNALENSGFYINIENGDEELYFDSIQFISAIVEIEQIFQISVPNEYLSAENLNNFNEYCEMISLLIAS